MPINKYNQKLMITNIAKASNASSNINPIIKYLHKIIISTYKGIIGYGDVDVNGNMWITKYG